MNEQSKANKTHEQSPDIVFVRGVHIGVWGTSPVAAEVLAVPEGAVDSGFGRRVDVDGDPRPDTLRSFLGTPAVTGTGGWQPFLTLQPESTRYIGNTGDKAETLRATVTFQRGNELFTGIERFNKVNQSVNESWLQAFICFFCHGLSYFMAKIFTYIKHSINLHKLVILSLSKVHRWWWRVYVI